MININNNELIRYVCAKLKNDRNVDLEYQINGLSYKIKFLAADINKSINIPSIIAIPLSEKINNQLVLESNNLESNNLEDIIKQGVQTGIRLAGLTIQDKIFLNGYSSSGVFAQRFSLLHPEIVDTACIGGASGSIPIPTEKLAYPIGIANYESLTGKKFDLESYSNIKFRYYVGELETQNKSDLRVDDFGEPAPIHDMSYFDRSVTTDIGKLQRNILGTEMFFRAENTIKILQNLGIDIQHKIILGRNHNNKNGIGVNELGDRFIIETYRNSIKNENKISL